MSSEKRYDAIKAIAELKVEGPCPPVPADIEGYAEDVFDLAAMQKHLPKAVFEKLQATIEEGKALPWNAVYDEFCVRNNVPVGNDYIPEILQYEKDVTSKR